MNTGHRILKNIMGDRWGKNGVGPKYIPKELIAPPNYWKATKESYGYPSHIPVGQCTNCGKILPTPSLFPNILPTPPHGPSKLKVCNTCLPKTYGYKMAHGISPPYPAQKLTRIEKANIIGVSPYDIDNEPDD